MNNFFKYSLLLGLAFSFTSLFADFCPIAKSLEKQNGVWVSADGKWSSDNDPVGVGSPQTFGKAQAQFAQLPSSGSIPVNISCSYDTDTPYNLDIYPINNRDNYKNYLVQPLQGSWRINDPTPGASAFCVNKNPQGCPFQDSP